MIRVVLPPHLQTLAQVGGGREVTLHVTSDGPLTRAAVLDALEARYPMLRGTARSCASSPARRI